MTLIERKLPLIYCMIILGLTVTTPLLAQTALTTAQKIEALGGRDYDTTFRWYLNHHVEWAKQHEADGDLLRANGDCWRAVKTDHPCALNSDQAFQQRSRPAAVDKSTRLGWS
jgi:hypothetical protein